MITIHLTQLRDKDISSNEEVAEVLEWAPRTTVKIVIKNSEGKIALVTYPIHNCFM